MAVSAWNPGHVSKAALIERHRFATSDAATADDLELRARAARIKELEDIICDVAESEMMYVTDEGPWDEGWCSDELEALMDRINAVAAAR